MQGSETKGEAATSGASTRKFMVAMGSSLLGAVYSL